MAYTKRNAMKRLPFAKYDHSCCGSMQARLSDLVPALVLALWVSLAIQQTLVIPPSRIPSNVYINPSYWPAFEGLMTILPYGDHRTCQEQTNMLHCSIPIQNNLLGCISSFCCFISEFLFLTARFLVTVIFLVESPCFLLKLPFLCQFPFFTVKSQLVLLLQFSDES